MTDETTEPAAAPANAPRTQEPETQEPGSQESAGGPLSGRSRTFWAGVGIGSAAIVAAVMYARRPRRKRG